MDLNTILTFTSRELFPLWRPPSLEETGGLAFLNQGLKAHINIWKERLTMDASIGVA